MDIFGLAVLSYSLKLSAGNGFWSTLARFDNDCMSSIVEISPSQFCLVFTHILGDNILHVGVCFIPGIKVWQYFTD